MRWLEIAKWSSMLSFSDATDDMTDYYLYFLIPLSSAGCDIEDVYGTLLFAKTVFAFFNKPGCGWLVDATSNHIHITLICSAFFQLFSSIILLFFGQKFSTTGLVFAYLMFKLGVILNVTTLWKAVKFRTQLLYGAENVEKQERTISLCGVLQGITSDVYETSGLAITYGLILGTDDFETCRWCLLIIVFIGNIYLAVCSLTITRNSLYVQDWQKDTVQLIISKSSDITNSSNNSVNNQSSTENHNRNNNNNNNNIDDNQQSKLNCSLIYDKIYNFVYKTTLWLWYKSCIFFMHELALHAVILSWVLYFFTNMVEYPLTFILSNSSENKDNGSIENFCNDQITNLIEESMIDNVAYAVGSILFLIFLVRCPTSYFFFFVFPYVAVATAVLTCLLWILATANVPDTLIYVLKSVVLVTPYFMEKYNFYFWTSVIDESHFGYYYGIYGLVQNAIHFSSSAILAFFPESMNTESPLFAAIIMFNLCLIIYDYVYCLWYATTYCNYFFIGHAKNSENNENNNNATINANSFHQDKSETEPLVY
eukprot:TRINITY_DN3115_c3_g1_i1.p1 TRINITY_DN3115_c3_g1~~TRINITY_DN3115_c3_g1_i1.p1  ORF type:complete len:539 (+),score=213.83 TRINITY_DN3115_c3_g1_i1:61-1677(+)